MLNKYKYKNKVRYHFREKKNIILSWELEDKKNKINENYSKWRNNIILKDKKINSMIYTSTCKRYDKIYIKKQESIKDKNWAYLPVRVLKKKPFFSFFFNRKSFFNNIIDCLNKKDSLVFIRNSLYYFYENNQGLHKIMDVLNFTWLYENKNNYQNKESFDTMTLIALKFFYKGFIKKGLKRQCEKKFLEVLVLLKMYLKRLNKSGLQLITFFFHFLKPLVGFRRKRLGRNSIKKKDIRFFYKLYHHNWRWQSLLFKRLCLNSPFYTKRSTIAKPKDIAKGLVNALSSKGPIFKGLISYYSLIGKRTPYVKRKKKKKKKRGVKYMK